MKKLVALVSLVLSTCALAPAYAQTPNPPCKPSSPVSIRYSTTLDGAWAYWWCTSNTYVPRMILWRDVSEPLRTRAKAYMLGNDPSFADLAPANDGTSAVYDALWADMRIAIAADTDRPPVVVPPPAVVWRVAPNGVLPDRAKFPLVNGKRSFASSGRTAVGVVTPAPLLTEGATTYCLVTLTEVAPCSRSVP